MGSVRFAIGLPNVGPFADPAALVDLAVSADGSGWDAVFLWDHLLYRDGWDVTDPWVALGAIATRTHRVRLGLLVAALPRQLPWEVAKRAVSLQQLSGGRFVLGAGLGSIPEEHSGFGADPDPRVRADRLDEALRVIRGLTGGQPFSHEGEHFRVRDVALRPAAPDGGLPIWIGGRWPNRRPMRRAARWDGLVATHADHGKGETMPPGQLREVVDYALEHRDPLARSLDVAVEGWTDEAPDRAWAQVEPYVGSGLTWWIEALGWWRGDLQAASRRIEAGPPKSPSDLGEPGSGEVRAH